MRKMLKNKENQAGSTTPGEFNNNKQLEILDDTKVIDTNPKKLGLETKASKGE